MYPTISFKRSLVYTAVLTAFTVPFSHAVFAEEAADPTQNSDIQLIQSNQSNVDDRNKADNLAYIRSQGQGGVVLKGADASGIVQQIMPGLVNRGNPSDYLSNVLDLTVNNDNVDSQNTFYISQIGGSWLVMNVDGENNTVRIADLAGIGFEKANAQDMTTDDAQAPAQATNINITGDYNALTLTPNIIGNIARKMQVTMDEGEGLNQYNVINISYSDFSDIVTKLSNASYSTIDVTQTDFTGDVDDVSSNPNIVFIDVMDADNTTVVLNQTGLGNEARLNVTNDFNSITLTQESAAEHSRDYASINIDGHNNSVSARQNTRTDDHGYNHTFINVQNGDDNVIDIFQESRLDMNDIFVSIANGDKNIIKVDQRTNSFGLSLIDVNIDNGSRNNVSIFQSNFDYDFHDSFAHLRINGSDNKVVVDQSSGDKYFMDFRHYNWLDLDITGDQNRFKIKNDWLDSNLSVDSFTSINGNHNAITFSNLDEFFAFDPFRSSNFYSVMNITGDFNTITALSDAGENDFLNILIEGDDNELNTMLSSGTIKIDNLKIAPNSNDNKVDITSIESNTDVNMSIHGSGNLANITNKFNTNPLNIDTLIYGFNNEFSVNSEGNQRYDFGERQLNTDISGSANKVMIDLFTNIPDTNNLLNKVDVTTTISNGSNNFVKLESTTNDKSDNIYDMYLEGSFNQLVVLDTNNNSSLDVDIAGNRNHILYESDPQNTRPQTANVDVAGSYNTLLLTPSISNSTYSVIGDDNYLSMTGHADELSSSIMSISGNDNTIDMDVAGLNGAVNINFTGDNNVMDFVLWAGDLDYTLTGSDFIGAVKTVGSAYYQQIERLGTGYINMQTAAGVVNISSNCGQACGNAI